MPSYAVIQTGGKQYRVQPGDVIDVEKLDQEVGARIDFPDVLLVDAGGAVSVGTPTVDGARVTAEVADQFRGPKIIVYKYKAKTHYRRKNGHRQSYTRLHIRHILTDGADEPEEVVAAEPVAEAPAPVRRRRSTRAAAAQAEAPVADEPAAESPAEAAAEEAPAPARRRRSTRAAAQAETPAAPEPEAVEAEASADAEASVAEESSDGEEKKE